MACSEVGHFGSGQRMDESDQPGEPATDAAGQWRLSREFGRKGSGPGEFNGTFGIAATHAGELAVADYWNKRVVVCGANGTLKETIPLSERPQNVAAIPEKRQLLVVDTSGYVKVFDASNRLDFQFPTVPSQDVGNVEVDLRSVAVKRDGTVVVGDVRRRVWTEHRPADGGLLRTVALQIPPYYLAAVDGGSGSGGDDRLLVSGYEQKRVEIADGGTGATVATIRPSIQDRPVANCLAVRCRGSAELYAGVSNGWNSDGHVHLYDADGSFRDCLARGLTFPLGIAFPSERQLAVADGFSVKVFRKV